MTEPQNPGPTGVSQGPTPAQPSAPPPPAPPAKPPFDIKKCLARLTTIDKVVAIIAFVVLVGWALTSKDPFKGWFYWLALLGSLGVMAIVVLKALEVPFLPPALEKKAIAVVSLLPILGILIDSLRSFEHFLVFGGSIALAYVSAMTYWRKHISQIDLKSLDPDAPKGPPAAPGSPTPPK